MSAKNRTVEKEIARIASRAHGIATRRELLSAGLTRSEINWRLSTGALIPEYPGVYRVGHRAPSLEARYLAAVKACGGGALLSGFAAAFLLGLLRGREPEPEVTAPTERRVAGIHIRRCRGLDPRRDGMLRRRVPVTSVARTLVDIAPRLPPEELARACHEAWVRHRVGAGEVQAELERRPRAAGAGRLGSVLRGDAHVTLSMLERSFLDLLRKERLPLPRTNTLVGGRHVDCRWPELRLTIELDGYRFHGTRHAWELDRRREREAYARGDDFRRYTYGDVLEDPAAMLAELRILLGCGPARPR